MIPFMFSDNNSYNDSVNLLKQLTLSGVMGNNDRMPNKIVGIGKEQVVSWRGGYGNVKEKTGKILWSSSSSN